MPHSLPTPEPPRTRLHPPPPGAAPRRDSRHGDTINPRRATPSPRRRHHNNDHHSRRPAHPTEGRPLLTPTAASGTDTTPTPAHIHTHTLPHAGPALPPSETCARGGSVHLTPAASLNYLQPRAATHCTHTLASHSLPYLWPSAHPLQQALVSHALLLLLSLVLPRRTLLPLRPNTSLKLQTPADNLLLIVNMTISTVVALGADTAASQQSATLTTLQQDTHTDVPDGPSLKCCVAVVSRRASVVRVALCRCTGHQVLSAGGKVVLN